VVTAPLNRQPLDISLAFHCSANGLWVMAMLLATNSAMDILAQPVVHCLDDALQKHTLRDLKIVFNGTGDTVKKRVWMDELGNLRD